MRGNPRHGDYTPGPWEARKHHDDSHWFVDHQQGGEGYTLVDELSEGDANLIASAPDLLEACEVAFNRLREESLQWGSKTSEGIVENAIIKATGERPERLCANEGDPERHLLRCRHPFTPKHEDDWYCPRCRAKGLGRR